MSKQEVAVRAHGPGVARMQPVLNVNLRFFAWPVLALLLIEGPLLRGFFFEPDLLPAQVLMAAVFLLVAWQEALERRPLLGRHPLDWAVLALVAAYGLSYLVAVDRRAAFGELLKYGMYFMAYYAASRLVAAAGGARAGGGEEGANWAAGWSAPRAAAALARLVVAPAAIVAALGVLAAAGVVEFPAAVANGRVMSTLQYANALGGFMVLADLLALALLSTGGRLAGQAAGGVILYLCDAALMGTFSRGAWLAGLAGLVLLLAALSPAQRWRALYIQGVAAVLAGVAMRSVMPGMETPGYHGVTALAVNMLLAAALVPAYELAARWVAARPLRPRTRRVAAWVAAIYVGVVAAIYFSYIASVMPSATSQILPDEVVYRAEAIDPGQASVVQRKESMRDALRIWGDHPFIGAGGGGWNALYHQYQRSLYWTTEVHSAPLQVAVETGVVGVAAFLAVWWFFLRGAMRLWRREHAEAMPGPFPAVPTDAAVLPAGLGVAALALGLHSIGDFDLSLPALALTLWALFGAVAGLKMAARAASPAGAAGDAGALARWRLLLPAGRAVAPVVAALALALPSMNLYRAGQAGAEGARLMERGNLQAAADSLAAAAGLDPRRASYRMDLGQAFIIAGVEQGRPELVQRGEQEVRAALDLRPHNIRMVIRAIEVFTLGDRPDLAAAEAERLAELLPIATFPYERLGAAYVAAAQAELRKGGRAPAEAYIEKAAGLPERVEGLETGGGGSRTRGRTLPRVMSPIRLAAAQALYLKGEDGQAAEALRPLVRDKQVGAAAALWLAAAQVRAEGKAPAVAAQQGEALAALVSLPRPADIR